MVLSINMWKAPELHEPGSTFDSLISLVWSNHQFEIFEPNPAAVTFPQCHQTGTSGCEVIRAPNVSVLLEVVRRQLSPSTTDVNAIIMFRAASQSGSLCGARSPGVPLLVWLFRRWRLPVLLFTLHAGPGENRPVSSLWRRFKTNPHVVVCTNKMQDSWWWSLTSPMELICSVFVFLKLQAEVFLAPHTH